MAGKPAEPARSGHQPEIEPHPAAGPGKEGEHAGPVTIARHVKDDGRALIIYTRDPHAPA
jgi:hypothetical protein